MIRRHRRDHRRSPLAYRVDGIVDDGVGVDPGALGAPAPVRAPGTHFSSSLGLRLDVGCYDCPMGRPVTDQELADALSAPLDADGNDLRLAERAAQMSDGARQESEKNLGASLDQARTSLAKKRGG